MTSQPRTDAALQRIEAALARIEKVEPMPEDPRYTALRAQVEDNLTRLDRVIAKLAE